MIIKKKQSRVDSNRDFVPTSMIYTTGTDFTYASLQFQLASTIIASFHLFLAYWILVGPYWTVRALRCPHKIETTSTVSPLKRRLKVPLVHSLCSRER